MLSTHLDTQAETDTDAQRPMPTFTLDTVYTSTLRTLSSHTQTCVCLSKARGRGSERFPGSAGEVGAHQAEQSGDCEVCPPPAPSLRWRG